MLPSITEIPSSRCGTSVLPHPLIGWKAGFILSIIYETTFSLASHLDIVLTPITTSREAAFILEFTTFTGV